MNQRQCRIAKVLWKVRRRWHAYVWISVALQSVPFAAEWPRVIYRDGTTNIIYQPQLESWDYTKLKAVSAIAIQKKGAAQQTFGTIKFVARTRVDRAQRQVFLEEIEIPEADFPSAGAEGPTYLASLRSSLPKDVKSISLDRLEASMAIMDERKKATGYPLKNDPPKILFSKKPAMLIRVDGPPIFRTVKGTKVDRVVNTRALILRDGTGTHYVHLFDGYVKGPALTGPWTNATQVSDDIKRAERDAVREKEVDLLAGQEDPATKKKASLKSAQIPDLYIVTEPTELIVVHGEPQYAPILSTQIMYVTNTASHVFRHLSEQKHYLLLSGRWFRSSDLAGPWEYVRGGGLPTDFANIPDESPKENVKASVPGTRQAEEATIANSIPQTVKVDRKKARMDPPPEFDGPVQLKAIEGTPLTYVENCQLPVIRAPDAWYACQNGVWFVGSSSAGPWTAATNVPQTVYSIPPSSPLHYVSYSSISNFDANSVWVAITPGFYGTVVDPDGIVVYGTGYDYPAFVGTTIYVAYPPTYGYAASPTWTPWGGWSYGFASTWPWSDDWYWWSYCPPAPYWGSYWWGCYGAYYNAYGGISAWGPYGWAGTSGYIYHQNGPWTGVSRGTAGYNAWTGNQWATRYGRAYNSTTGTRAVGQRGAVENVYTGNYAYGGRGAFYNENTGIAAAGGRVTVGNENTGNSVTAGRGTVYNPTTGNAAQISGIKGEHGGAINVNGNVIAGRDGNYYRPNGQGGWEQVTRPGAGGSAYAQNVAAQNATIAHRQNLAAQQQAQWQQADTARQQREALERENRARQAGAQRQQSYQKNRPTYNTRPSSARAGGSRGGGGRR